MTYFQICSFCTNNFDGKQRTLCSCVLFLKNGPFMIPKVRKHNCFVVCREEQMRLMFLRQNCKSSIKIHFCEIDSVIISGDVDM